MKGEAFWIFSVFLPPTVWLYFPGVQKRHTPVLRRPPGAGVNGANFDEP